MAIKAKLDTAWNDNLMQDATFEFRAIIEDLYNNVYQAQLKIQEILTRPVFTNVDAEIKTEGLALRTLVNNTKTALDAHLDFILWRQS